MGFAVDRMTLRFGFQITEFPPSVTRTLQQTHDTVNARKGYRLFEALVSANAVTRLL